MTDFNTYIERTGTKSVKWDGAEAMFQSTDVLPMWIADMDFKAPEAVNQALVDRAKHGVYGYTLIDDDVRYPIIDWLNKRHQWPVDANTLSFSPTVVASIDVALRTFSEPEDKILIQTPVYPPFFQSIQNTDRTILTNSLVRTEDHYEIDFVDLENKLKADVKIFLLCSPHNPVGRVWEKAELMKMAELCLKYDVLILADEIHSDLIYKPAKHVPIASLSSAISAQTITLMAPSKTFNLAGLQASFIVTENAELKSQLDHALVKYGFKQLNTMAITALEAAYRYGEPWLEELLIVLEEHKNYCIERLQTCLPELKLIDPEGTYLLWVDFSSLGLSDTELQQFFVEKAKVALNPGLTYGTDGEQFMRINFACHQSTLTKGINQIIEAIQELKRA